LVERVYQTKRIFPNPKIDNVAISTTGAGASREFSALITDCVPNLHLHDTGQCFPLYRYLVLEGSEGGLFGVAGQHQREDAISDRSLASFRTQYDTKIEKEDIFNYIYGILHSPEYKERFATDLKKMLPRIPFAREFWAFSIAGRKLAKWHLEYEKVEPYPLEETISGPRIAAKERFRVSKMNFGKTGGKTDKSIIVFNSHVTLSGIPLASYEYVVNGKPALEWVMERYQVTTDKDSGILNDPNEWSADPRYIRVSLETMKIVRALPALLVDSAMTQVE
jgi:predicted helicase